MTRAEGIMTILTGVGILVAIVTGAIFYLQLDEMRNGPESLAVGH